jgi:hypothetical protein
MVMKAPMFYFDFGIDHEFINGSASPSASLCSSSATAKLDEAAVQMQMLLGVGKGEGVGGKGLFLLSAHRVKHYGRAQK